MNQFDVVIIEDDPIVREALFDTTSNIEHFKVSGVAASFEQGKQILANDFDLMLVDLNLGDGSGIDLIHLCRSNKPQCKIVVISVFGDERNVIRAIEAGADGYLLKDISALDLEDALNRIVNGEYPISPSIAGHLLKRVRKPPQPQGDDSLNFKLTKRESEILQLLAKGYTYQEVSGYLEISYHTVADYIKAIYKKLSVNSKSQAIFEAAQAGLININDQH